MAKILLFTKMLLRRRFISLLNFYTRLPLEVFVPVRRYFSWRSIAASSERNYFILWRYTIFMFLCVQMLFKKQLSGMQWASVFLLTFGCIIKDINHAAKSHTVTSTPDSRSEDSMHTGDSSLWPYLDVHVLLILLQVFCSCFAGVYNEYLLKNTGCEIHIMMANVFMYLHSILCNLIVLVLKGELATAFTWSGVASLGQPLVITLIVNYAAIGIVTSLFLHTLNSIVKSFASALELMFTAVLCWVIFGIPIDLYTLLALAVVIGATVLYAQNPVINKSRSDIQLQSKSDDSKVWKKDLIEKKERRKIEKGSVLECTILLIAFIFCFLLLK